MNRKGKGVFKIIKPRNYKIISFCIDKHFNSNIIVVIQVQFSLKVNSVKTKLVKYLSSNISLKKKNKHILFNFQLKKGRKIILITRMVHRNTHTHTPHVPFPRSPP